jgi:hypothetical protein
VSTSFSVRSHPTARTYPGPSSLRRAVGAIDHPRSRRHARFDWGGPFSDRVLRRCDGRSVTNCGGPWPPAFGRLSSDDLGRSSCRPCTRMLGSVRRARGASAGGGSPGSRSRSSIRPPPRGPSGLYKRAAAPQNPNATQNVARSNRVGGPVARRAEGGAGIRAFVTRRGNAGPVRSECGSKRRNG